MLFVTHTPLLLNVVMLSVVAPQPPGSRRKLFVCGDGVLPDLETVAATLVTKLKNIFSSSLTPRKNKLACLSVANLLSLI